MMQKPEHHFLTVGGLCWYLSSGLVVTVKALPKPKTESEPVTARLNSDEVTADGNLPNLSNKSSGNSPEKAEAPNVTLSFNVENTE